MGSLPEREYTKAELERMHKQMCIGCVSCLRTERDALQARVDAAQRLLNFTPDQLELLVDPAKLAYVEWNLACTYTLQLMCERYREGKMEVRKAQGKLDAMQKRYHRSTGMETARTLAIDLDRILKEENDG